MEIGIYTFGDWAKDTVTGKQVSAGERMQQLIEEIVLADEVGLDVFGLGEHHRPDYLISSPAVVLAAAAVKTRKIKLTSAVTVLSSDDPVRVFQDFATVDLLSGGRAEIMAGRGSFIESFPLFGYDLDDYDTLFEEKLNLLLQLNKEEKVNWTGQHRASIRQRGVYPRPLAPIPVWIAVGGTPASVIRAATLRLPVALAIIGGNPKQFVPLINLYRETAVKTGFTNPVIGINSHVFIADTEKAAADTFYPGYADVMSRIGRERGWSPMTREQFDYMRAPGGSLLVGSPQQVIDKMLYEHELFGNSRFLCQMSLGATPHKEVLRSIELLGTVVAPAVRKALSS